jgi:hypothetical protein
MEPTADSIQWLQQAQTNSINAYSKPDKKPLTP